MFNGYKYIQAFSIDISLGGVVGALFISKYLQVNLSVFILAELALIIWLIYTFDHLTDAGSDRYKLVTFRHKIHRDHSLFIWGIWSFILVVAFSLLFKIPSILVIYGSVLSFIVALYFLSLKLLEDKKIYHKEVSASIIYASGIFVGPLSQFDGKFGIDFWILFIQFTLLAFVNLLVFSIFELEIDKESGFKSFVKSTGYEKSRWVTVLLIGLISISALISMIIFRKAEHIFFAQLIILAMVVILSLILFNKRSLIINGRFRLLGDAVFFLPLIYILV